MVKELYHYKAKVLKCYDADTVTLLIDVGFNIFIKEKVRLYALDTPELRTKDLEEKKAGYAARDFVRKLILKKQVIIKTIKKTKKDDSAKSGKFGRLLVEIFLEDGTSLNNLIIAKGHGRLYYGEKKVPWREWGKQ